MEQKPETNEKPGVDRLSAYHQVGGQHVLSGRAELRPGEIDVVHEERGAGGDGGGQQGDAGAGDVPGQGVKGQQRGQRQHHHHDPIDHEALWVER